MWQDQVTDSQVWPGPATHTDFGGGAELSRRDGSAHDLTGQMPLDGLKTVRRDLSLCPPL